LRRYSGTSGWVPRLPVPVEDIVECCYGLSILFEAIDEAPGEVILGELAPLTRTIRLNEQHLNLFETWVGPEAFTLGHELGHWLYDAEDPNQGQLFNASGEKVFCRRPDSAQVGDSELREVNANKFSSCLLLPEELVRAQVREPFASWNGLSRAAASWGVSRTTLRIRLETLGMRSALPA
jgi:hypothetical protein